MDATGVLSDHVAGRSETSEGSIRLVARAEAEAVVQRLIGAMLTLNGQAELGLKGCPQREPPASR